MPAPSGPPDPNSNSIYGPSPLLPQRDLPYVAGDLRLLISPAAALKSMVEMIRGAQSEISMSYFTIWPCAAVTHVLLSEIARRRETLRRQGRALRVRMIFDPINYSRTLGLWLSQFNLRASIRHFEAQGIEVKLYNTEGLANRSHIKIFEVDGRLGLAGSRNWEDVSFGFADGVNLTELDVEVGGPAAAQLKRLIDLQWTSPMTSRPGLINSITPDFSEDPAATREALNRCLAELPRKFDFADVVRRIERTPLPHQIRCPAVRVLSDLPHGYDAPRQMAPALDQLLATARRNVEIMNYTFIPVGPTLSTFERLARRPEVRVEVLTNGSYDDVPGDIELLAHRRIARFAQAGFSFAASSQNDRRDDWLANRTSKKVLHVKSFVVDGMHSAVTSYNLDPLSILSNLESGVFAYHCPTFASELHGEFARLRAASEPMGAGSSYGRAYESRRAALPWHSRFFEETYAELKKIFL